MTKAHRGRRSSVGKSKSKMYQQPNQQPPPGYGGPSSYQAVPASGPHSKYSNEISQHT